MAPLFFLTPTQLVYIFVYNRMNILANNIYDCEKKYTEFVKVSRVYIEIFLSKKK